MSILVMFKITSLMCFLFAIKTKMYFKNLIGFITICTVFLSILMSYFIGNFAKTHYLLITLLLLFIVSYNTYKTYKRNTQWEQ